jgi:hypothetical protein
MFKRIVGSEKGFKVISIKNNRPAISDTSADQIA